MNRNRKWLRPVLIALGCVGLACTLFIAMFIGFVYIKAEQTLDKVSAQPSHTEPDKPTDEDSTEPAKTNSDEKNRPVMFLLTAIDHRPGSDGSLNTDVIMLMVWEPETKSITLLSVPRDLKMQPPGFNPHKANYYYAYYYNQDKNSALSNTKQLYREYFDLPIDYMAIINFDGFRDLVDVLGGTTIDVEMNMRYVDPTDGTNINLKKGLQQLDGKNTLDYLRYRKSNYGTAESSDMERNQRQQLVFKQLIDKLTSLNGISKIDKLFDIVGDNLQTDIPADVLREWVLNARKLKPTEFNTLTVDSEWISPYIYVDEDQWDEALQQLRDLMSND